MKSSFREVDKKLLPLSFNFQIVAEKGKFRRTPFNYAMKKNQLLRSKVFYIILYSIFTQNLFIQWSVITVCGHFAPGCFALSLGHFATQSPFASYFATHRNIVDIVCQSLLGYRLLWLLSCGQMLV